MIGVAAARCAVRLSWLDLRFAVTSLQAERVRFSLSMHMNVNRSFPKRGRFGLVVVLALSVSIIPSRAVAQSAAAPTTQPTVESMLIELQKLVTEQRALIDGQAERIGALERDLATLKQPQVGVALLPVPAAAAGPPPSSPAQEAQRQPEMPREAVSAGDFPGSIRIPGTDSAIKFGGQARMTLVNTLGPLGTDDRFVTSSIPVGDQQAGEEARTVYSPSASRFGLDLRSPFLKRTIRTFIEGDFAGPTNTFRLRHAFMQTSHWVVGQTWSTFSDPEAEPIGIDFEGLNAISLFRQPQIRYTLPLRAQLQLALALENPAPDLTGAQGVNLHPRLHRARALGAEGSRHRAPRAEPRAACAGAPSSAGNCAAR